MSQPHADFIFVNEPRRLIAVSDRQTDQPDHALGGAAMGGCGQRVGRILSISNSTLLMAGWATPPRMSTERPRKNPPKEELCKNVS
jgi:hypothetical protein